MSFRKLLATLEERKSLHHVDTSISKYFEVAGVLKQLEPEGVFFSRIKESEFAVAGNLFTGKAGLAAYFNIPIRELIPTLTHAINQPSRPEHVRSAPCQEAIDQQPDLDSLPILRHCAHDGGSYISSGVAVASHPVWGQNLDFHRCMQISRNELAVRIVRNRHFDTFLKDQKSMPVAICIGVPPAVLLAAATSVEIGTDEMEIANTLEPLKLVKAATVDVWVPAESEFVIEGVIHFDRVHSEGPFVDLTGTYDIIRQQPIMDVTAITHRKDAIWHALLPGALEHKLLMGMPREPTIFKKVNEVADCLDVNITPGGASWLHAVVQIKKQSEGDGKAAIEAAFSGHRSCKHVFVVDQDIDIYDPHQVEWAMATRFQGDRDLVINAPEQGSSLDPSADPETNFTTKLGFDLTAPLDVRGKSYIRADFPKVDLASFLPGEKTA